MLFYTDRLRKFLETKTDVEISAQPALEDQTLDFSDVEQLLVSINTIPGAPSGPPELCIRSSDDWKNHRDLETSASPPYFMLLSFRLVRVDRG